ncbi:MAG: hypothetical protein ABI559_11255 [Chloroflexota bacterium]
MASDWPFDDSPKRIWVGATVPGKKMVRALGYDGLEAGKQIDHFYREYPVHQVIYALALTMHEILKPDGRVVRGAAIRDVRSKSVSWSMAYGAILSDLRDFLKLRYRAGGLANEPKTVIEQAKAFVSAPEDHSDNPAWTINFAIEAFDILSQAKFDLLDDFMPAITGLREHFRAASRTLNPLPAFIDQERQDELERKAFEL